MKLALIAFTRRGAALARKLAQALEEDGLLCSLTLPARLAEELDLREASYENLRSWAGARFQDSGGLIFVGAAGIAVRAVAPYVRDKLTDPAVVSVDEAGQFAVPLLSGHVGGGNDLARRIAGLTGGQAVISTATDVNGLFAVDQWAAGQGMSIASRKLAKEVSAALLDGRPVGFCSDFGHRCPPDFTGGTGTELGVWVTCKTGPEPFPRTLRLAPKCLTLGIGCRRGTERETIAAAVSEAMEGLDPAAVCQIATIDLKRDEPGLLAFCREWELPLVSYTAAELAEVPGDFTISSFVAEVTGVDNVCERAAVRAGGALLRPKRAKNGVTVAVAERRLEWE